MVKLEHMDYNQLVLKPNTSTTCSGQTMYNMAVDAGHNLLYVATSHGNASARSIIELPLTISGETMPYKAGERTCDCTRLHCCCCTEICLACMNCTCWRRDWRLAFKAICFIARCTARENVWLLDICPLTWGMGLMAVLG